MGISPVRSQNRIDRIGLVLFLLLSGNDFRYSRVQKRNRPVVKLNRVLVKRRWLYRTKEGLIDTLLYGRQFQVHVPTSKYWYFDSTHTHSEETKEHKPLQHITHHHHNNSPQPTMASKLLHLHHLIVAILFITTCRSDCLNIPILFSKGANKGLKMVNSKSNEPTATRTRTAFASKRVHETLDPCVVLMKQLITKHQHLWVDEQIYSLAQGVVYWTPPETANEKISSALSDPNSALHTYAPDEGIPELISAIKEKLARENKLPEDGSCNSDDVQVIVTSGANQAYMNCVLTLLDEGDLSVVFKPYYFNHVMAIQMTRGNEALLVGPVDDDGYPSIVWLKEQFESEKGNAIKMITITNPGNPTGVSIPKQNLQEIVDLCREYEKIIVFDCTYEQFDHSSANAIPINEDLASEGFFCFSDEHVVNIFSFSKGYAMAGFRVGYVVVNTCGSEGKDIYEQMVKVQDTIPIATSRLSQVREGTILPNVIFFLLCA